MKRISLLIAVALIFGAIGTGVVGASNKAPVQSVAPQQEEGLTLTIGTTDSISELDPANAYSFHDWEILRNVSESLIGYVPGTTDLEPRLATAMPEVSEDGLTYTFTLRDDAMFPDGSVLTAEMYATWVTRSLTLQGDPYALISNIASVEAGENNTVVFTLTVPDDLLLLTLGALPEVMPFQDGDFPMDDFNNQPEAIHGVGPYQLTEYIIGEQEVLERNPNYYGEPGIYDKIVFLHYSDGDQLTLAIETGEIDIAWRNVTTATVENLVAQENLEVLTLPGGIRYFGFNHASEIGGNPLIRTAIAKAIDRDEVIDRGLGGLASPLYSFVPQGFAGASESYLDQYGFRDLEGAIADLEAAGYSEDNKLQLEVWYPPDHYGDQAGDAMAVIEQQLEETGLIDVTLQSQEWSTYIVAATAGEYPFFMLGWFFDYPDADNYINPFASCVGSPGLGFNFCDEQMDALIAAERTSLGTPEREDNLIAAQDYFAEQVVGIPLWSEQTFMVWDTTKVSSVTLGAALIFEYRLVQPAAE
jgi:peptide/nickel transport system substrate-binding protein